MSILRPKPSKNFHHLPTKLQQPNSPFRSNSKGTVQPHLRVPEAALSIPQAINAILLAALAASGRNPLPAGSSRHLKCLSHRQLQGSPPALARPDFNVPSWRGPSSPPSICIHCLLLYNKPQCLNSIHLLSHGFCGSMSRQGSAGPSKPGVITWATFPSERTGLVWLLGEFGLWRLRDQGPHFQDSYELGSLLALREAAHSPCHGTSHWPL